MKLKALALLYSGFLMTLSASSLRGNLKHPDLTKLDIQEDIHVTWFHYMLFWNCSEFLVVR